MELSLIIGNKSYSSWSLRAWLAVRYALGSQGFEEVKLPLAGSTASDEEKARAKDILRNYSPTGKVPALTDKKLNIIIYDSLSINLFMAERCQESLLFPSSTAAKAICISAACEMHSGFDAIRTHCPMNCVVTARHHGLQAISREDVRKDLQRLCELWTTLRETYGLPYEASDRPQIDGRSLGYLFGHFTIADCMYAPIALRLRTYDPELTSVSAYPLAHSYVLTLLQDPGVVEWVNDALQEGSEWKLAHYDSVSDPTPERVV
jgi:glutathione S-transferase